MDRKRSANNNANNQRETKRQRTNSNSNVYLSQFKAGIVRPLPERLVRTRACVPYTDDTLTQIKGYGELYDDQDFIDKVPDVVLDSSPTTLAKIADGGVYNYIMFANFGENGYTISATYALPLEFGTKHKDIYRRLTQEQSMNYVCSGEFSFNFQKKSLVMNEISSLFWESDNAKYIKAAAVLKVAPDILQHIQYIVNNDPAYNKIPLPNLVLKPGKLQQAEILQHVANAKGDDLKLLSLIYETKGYVCTSGKNFAMSTAYKQMFLEVVSNPFKSIFGPDVTVTYQEKIMSNSPQLKLTNSTKDLLCAIKSPLNYKMYATQENCAANTNPTQRWCNQ